MKSVVELSYAECLAIYGGKNDSVAKVVEIVAQFIGAFAKLLYLTAKRGPKAISDQMASGYYPKF